MKHWQFFIATLATLFVIILGLTGYIIYINVSDNNKACSETEMPCQNCNFMTVSDAAPQDSIANQLVEGCCANKSCNFSADLGSDCHNVSHTGQCQCCGQ